MKIKFVILITLIFLTVGCTNQAPALTNSVIPSTYPYQRPLIVAHRGARSVAPENTLLAAERAFAFNADQWELDVQETKDGELIVLHDGHLRRTTNVESVFPGQFPFWKTHTFTLAQIQQLDAGFWYTRQDPFDEIKSGNISTVELQKMENVSIPTLREALEYTKSQDWFVNIEIKDLTETPGDKDVVEKTVALIDELGMQDHVLISSFNMDYLVRVKRANPKIQTAALVKKLEDPITLLKSIGADAINPSYEGIEDLQDIMSLRDAGYDVYVWTVNDEQEMITLINAGVSGIITDYPQKMVAVLNQYEH